MEGYLDNNLVFLKEQYSSIYQMIGTKKRDSEKYILNLSKSNDPNILVKNEITNTLHAIHSKYNPCQESEKWLAQYENDINIGEHICLYGFGLGYYLEAIIKRYPDKKIFIYEPEIEIFLGCLEGRDITGLLSHSNIVTMGIGNSELANEYFFQYLLSQSYGNISLLVAPAYQVLYQEKFQDFKDTLLKRIQMFRSNLATLRRFGLEWTENIFLNLPSFIKGASIYRLQNKFEKIPAIIVGSGPSLQDDIDYLHQLKKHALIIAAGSSIQALLKAGIEPHMIVSIDGGKSNYNVFKNIDISQIPLAAGSFIKHNILEGEIEPLFHVPLDIDLISTYLFNLFDTEPKIFSTTSVTGTAIQIAKLFGCSKIIFMGQDLSFPQDQYYSSGVVHITSERLENKVAEADLLVRNVEGGENRTSKNMLVTLRDIEHIIKFIDIENRLSFINTSKYGAHIQGTEFLTIKEVLDQISQLPPLNIESFFQNTDSYGEELAKHVYSKLEQLLEELNKVKPSLMNILEKMDLLKDVPEATDVYSTLLTIENQWNEMTRKSIFKYVIQFTLQFQVTTYLRYVPVIVTEKDLTKKGELIHKHLGNLLVQILQAYDKLEDWISRALQKLEVGSF